MPIKFGIGEQIKSGIDTYEVETVLSQGYYAHAARAKSTAAKGKPVFLKRYFSPTRALSWYADFIEHQQELKRRIKSNDGLGLYCYKFLDFFEGTEGRSKKTFHQVFEFIDNGKPLSAFLREVSTKGAGVSWVQQVMFARVMMMGITALHDQRIVHTDLKPDNLLLVPSSGRPDTYHLKIIDMDFAIFSDRKAPWHGHGDGYVGTDGYMSPEHLIGQVPNESSDVFTCAIMLGELLGCGHPFIGTTSEDLSRAVIAGEFRPFTLASPIDKVENPAYLESLINRALDPDPAQRPSAKELKDALLGRGPAMAPAPPAASAKPANQSGQLPQARAVELLHVGKSALKISIDTTVGRAMLKPVSADAQFMAEAQFKIHRSADKAWTVSPCSDTLNETLLDGQLLTTPTPLHEGMRISVGNSAKRIEKLPLTVHLLYESDNKPPSAA